MDVNVKFEIGYIDEISKWIFIRNVKSTGIFEEDFIYFMKELQHYLNGEIYEIGDTRYRISNDKLGLVYQWDDCFGIVVEYQNKSEKEDTVKLLNNVIGEISH